MNDLGTVQAAVGGLAKGLAADGYELRVDGLDGTTLRVSVAAGADACAECLVPKPVMSGIVLQTVGDRFGVSEVALTYPTDTDVTGKEEGA